MNEITLTESELQAILKSAVNCTVSQILSRMISESVVTKDDAFYQSICKDYGVKE